MSLPSSTSASPVTLERRIGLRSAGLFNMLEMIGVGPFITLPLVIAAAGFRMSVWAWVLGAAIAVADGLVWDKEDPSLGWLSESGLLEALGKAHIELSAVQ